MSDISTEALLNEVAEIVGSLKALKILATDNQGNALVLDGIGWEKRFDYDSRSDGQPVYIGYANPGTATTAITWLIHKVTYDGNDYPTRIQVATAAWDSRTGAF